MCQVGESRKGGECPAVFLDILKGHDYSILVNLSNMLVQQFCHLLYFGGGLFRNMVDAVVFFLLSYRLEHLRGGHPGMFRDSRCSMFSDQLGRATLGGDRAPGGCAAAHQVQL